MFSALLCFVCLLFPSTSHGSFVIKVVDVLSFRGISARIEVRTTEESNLFNTTVDGECDLGNVRENGKEVTLSASGYTTTKMPFDSCNLVILLT